MKTLVLLILVASWCSAQTVWFEPNQGQVKGKTEWIGRSQGAYLYMTGNEVVYANKTNVHMRLIGAKTHARVEGSEPTGGYSNYFTGRDEKTWFTGIPHYARLRYKEVYPGIDLAYYGSGRNAEYDFIVKAGGNPDRIELAFSEPVRIDHGNLIVAGLRQHQPKVLQGGIEIAAAYEITKSGHVRVALGEYDGSRDLTVDPVLEFSSYIGGPGSDGVAAIVLDQNGFIYLAGYSQSPATPSLNPFQQTNLVSDAPFVAKLSADGKHLIYYSVLGSGGWDDALNLKVDTAGNLVLTGRTRSANFPLKNPIQSALKAAYWNAFLSKLSGDGRSLVFSTYLGGSNEENPYGLALDQQDNIYVAGHTLSNDFPIKNAYQSSYLGASHCFLTKVTSSGSLLFSTYFGGSSREFCWGLTVATDGGAIVSGGSGSSDFPLRNPGNTKLTERNGYTTPTLFKFSPDGQSLVFSTFVGGPVAGGAQSVALDPAGNIYVGGWASDAGMATKNAFQARPNSTDSAILVKLDALGQSVIYSTYLDGGGGAEARGVAVNERGEAYLCGHAYSSDFPLSGSLQSFRGGERITTDAFLAKFSSAGNTLVYSTLLGGSSGNFCSNVVLDSAGSAYVAGITFSGDFPTKNAFQSSYGGANDGFYAKVSDDTAFTPSPLVPNPGSLAFRYVQGGTLPTPQVVMISGGSFTASVGATWLRSSVGGSAVTVSVDPASLAPGTYTSALSLTPSVATPTSVLVTFTVLAPAPVLNAVDPPVVEVGSDDTVIAIRGTGFSSSSSLQVDGIAWRLTPVQFVDSSTLKISLPASYFAVASNHIIAVQNPQSALSNVLSLAVGVAAPSFTATSVVNAGSFAGGPVAPGEIITIFGTNLTGNVTFDNIPATIVYFSATQISATVPYSVLGPKTSLQIGSSVPVSLDIAPSAPGIFAAVSNGDGTLTLYATGCGALTQDALPVCQLPVSATINGESAQALYAGIAPGLVQGANQINLAIPADVASGPLTIVLTAGTASSKPFSYTLP